MALQSAPLAFLEDRQYDLYRNLLISRMAQLALERGRWAAAEREALALIAGPLRSNQARVRVLDVLGRLRARRGEPGAWSALDEAMRIVGPGELQDICPLYAARAELPGSKGTSTGPVTGRCRLQPRRCGGCAVLEQRARLLGRRTGRIERLPDGTAEAYMLHAAGDHRGAAAGWSRAGAPYHRAAALADSDDEADLREALDLLHSLGARILAGRVTARLRDRGVGQIPRGPRPATRSNPAGLSSRELEVLALIRAGARDAEIADRLVISQKTVGHHVSAILRKLGVSSRDAARSEAERLGLEDEPIGPR
jgi:DNA-binding CsgD family transcriptional regulator